MSIPIQRQYTSPNCTLFLQGFSDDNNAVSNGIPVMTILTEARCQILGNPTVLSGGVTFVANLLRAVSAYGQELLSGLTHSWAADDDSDYVYLRKLPQKNRHLLVWQEKKEDSGNQLEIELSTVQLFDLLETLDQLLVDSATLPHLSDNLSPVSRRYRQMEVSLVEQSTPAVLGVAGFALSAIALFLIPIPNEIPDPNLEPIAPREENIEIDPELPLDPPGIE
ncbi:DUF4335 domain-containing protein [Cyanobacterium stanieri LEGE 03274]|uniref:DUF4335 domain-containing protein n=1 Tax=Cyanobacterium stanieri LEGE 03274 TaxID=1828756 RepID=A0ABR9V340_9CHRO|nr:DUF4335 domain-containing protein [Cyanobacterium stanieri]MBE9222318.1 DUF4335 domain-containing protein [Cyanobacterium stanieri LEGE 03274]